MSVLKLAYIFAVLAIMISTASALSIDMDRKEPYCFGILANATYNYEMNYFTYGKNNEKVKYDLYDPGNNIIKTGSGNSTDYFKQKVYQDGIYTICFTNLDGNTKKINFDVVANAEEPTPDVLEREHITRLEWELKSLYDSLERISHMITAHRDKIRTNAEQRKIGRRSIINWTYFKGIAILIIAAVKIYVMIKYFDIGEKARNFLGLSIGKNYV